MVGRPIPEHRTLAREVRAELGRDMILSRFVSKVSLVLPNRKAPMKHAMELRLTLAPDMWELVDSHVMEQLRRLASRVAKYKNIDHELDTNRNWISLFLK